MAAHGLSAAWVKPATGVKAHEERLALSSRLHRGEFKAKVALEAISGIRTVNEIGRELGVHPAQVGLWKKELLEQASNLFDAKRGPKPADPSASPAATVFGEWALEDGIGLAHIAQGCAGAAKRMDARERQKKSGINP